MAKSIQMEIVKGVSAQQHIQLHSMMYQSTKDNPHASVQFARWGSKESFEAGEPPLEILPPLRLSGRALQLYRKQSDVKGAAWALLDLALSGQIPQDLSSDIEMVGRDPAAKFEGAQTVLDPGQQPFELDMTVA